ncbi:juvenile hormone esterase-like [Culicoides brevitarsis]|uniref:juvenile hormone esterase-like n=1 Tax=Culicoides brevitarsis TaxID=469753 RepID=UPI00307CB0A3
MLRLIILLVLSVLVANSLAHQRKSVNEDLIITLHHGGKILGEKKSLSLNSDKKYFSFKGIPYAEPPMGELRFRSPQPHPGWNGIRNATEHGNICVQFGKLNSSEDCLFLNVYTPSNLNPTEKYPVMFWIHGGAFNGGSGNSMFYGPELLVKEDVIVVTINYRLGFLGFFSTNDRSAQGNYGLKDCVEALKWVQKNIEAFGGDRNRVTIFGQSAGGSMVHHLILSPMAKGLFHGAISQSGTALNAWGLQPYPRSVAFEAAKLLNITFNSTENLVNQLRDIQDPYQFAVVGELLEDKEQMAGYHPYPFEPSVEPEDSDEPRFLPDTPLKILQSGDFNKVPCIFGSTDDEMLAVIDKQRKDPDHLSLYNNDPNLLLPYEFFIQPNTEAAEDILNNIRKTYFNGQTEINDIMEFLKFGDDRVFLYSIYKTVEMHARKQTAPIFYYIFSYDGSLNLGKKLSSLSEYDGAMHSDDLGYLWKLLQMPAPIKPSDPARIVRQRMVKMWANFSKYGHPTPNVTELISVEWPKVRNHQEFLEIGEELIPKIDPFSQRMAMWKEMDQKYNNAQ